MYELLAPICETHCHAVPPPAPPHILDHSLLLLFLTQLAESVVWIQRFSPADKEGNAVTHTDFSPANAFKNLGKKKVKS